MRTVIIYLDKQDALDINEEDRKENYGLYDTHESVIATGNGIHLNKNGEELIAIEIHVKPL